MAEYQQKMFFSVLIDGFTLAQFKTCGPLEKEAEVVEEGEGGAITNTKMLGKVSVKNVVLTKGKTTDQTMHLWFQSAAITGETGAKAVTIVQKNRLGIPVKTYNLIEALPVRYKAGEWDAMSGESVVEELELAIKDFVEV